MDKVHAARAAGYQGTGANKAGSRLLKNPIVRQEIEAVQAAARTVVVYDLATAMKEAEDVCAFAKLHKNAMAYCKGTELRAKLSGLLIERVEIATVDLAAALERAERRVIDVTPQRFNTEQPQLADRVEGEFGYRGPGEPGDPFSE